MWASTHFTTWTGASWTSRRSRLPITPTAAASAWNGVDITSAASATIRNTGYRFRSRMSATSVTCANRKEYTSRWPLAICRGLSVHGFIEKHSKLSGFVIDVILEIRQAAFQGFQLVGQVQTGQDRRAGGVDVAGAHRDRGHQIVHPLSQMFDPARLLGSYQGIRLVKDSDTDRFRVRHSFSLSFLTGGCKDDDYVPLSRSICPSSFSMRVRTCLRSLRRSSSSWRMA